MVPAQCKRREFLACSRYGRKCHTANFGLPLSHAGINLSLSLSHTVTHCHMLVLIYACHCHVLEDYSLSLLMSMDGIQHYCHKMSHASDNVRLIVSLSNNY